MGLRHSTQRHSDRKTTMRRPSAYETRARELAALAGLDPDSRVARPGEDAAPEHGGRGMPAWCSFRDAARA